MPIIGNQFPLGEATPPRDRQRVQATLDTKPMLEPPPRRLPLIPAIDTAFAFSRLEVESAVHARWKDYVQVPSVDTTRDTLSPSSLASLKQPSY